MCLEPGNILRIRNFQFEDGGDPKDKYLIVVAVDQTLSVFVRCLTTSVQKIPDDRVTHGCCNSVCGTFSHYIFVRNRSICDNDFSFPMHTFVYYNHNVLPLSVEEFNKKSYEIIPVGKLTPNEYKRFIKCMKGSHHIKRGMKRIIDAIEI
jgi:hypothetical protein